MEDASSRASAQSIATFNRDELDAMISTAHALGVKVAAHANTAGAIETLLELGVDSIEHGSELHSPEKIPGLIKKFMNATGRTTWVPTLAAYFTISQTGSTKTWDEAKESFREALRLNMDNIACGGDTGVFTHGNNALELYLMQRFGANWNDVLTWATLGGWKCIRGQEWEGSSGEKKLLAAENVSLLGMESLDRDVPFGAIRQGWAADLIGIEGSLTTSAPAFQKAVTEGVEFVAKGGIVYKKDGIALF